MGFCKPFLAFGSSNTSDRSWLMLPMQHFPTSPPCQLLRMPVAPRPKTLSCKGKTWIWRCSGRNCCAPGKTEEIRKAVVNIDIRQEQHGSQMQVVFDLVHFKTKWRTRVQLILSNYIGWGLSICRWVLSSWRLGSFDLGVGFFLVLPCKADPADTAEDPVRCCALHWKSSTRSTSRNGDR